MRFLEFSSLFDVMAAFPTEESCARYLEVLRWNGNIASPFERVSKVYTCKNGKYKCDATNKYFNVRTGTIFQDSKMPLRKWIMALYIFTSHKKGISSYQLARDLSITQKTAWFVLHRLRYAMSKGSFWDLPLKGTVEADECYLGGREENKHEHLRNKDKDGFKVGSKRKEVVFGMVERGGKAIIKHVPAAKVGFVVPVIKANLVAGSQLMTDEHHLYARMGADYIHSTVEHGAKEYVRGLTHTNTIENLWSVLKRGIYGTYHFTSVKHLQAYCDEFAFRFNRRKLSEYDKVNSCLLNTTKGTLKYKTLVRKGGANA
ncbi:MAG: IS1595 family transposase [Bacteroidota bacterium]